MFCTGHPNLMQAYGANFCYKCGDKLVEEPKCKQCGFLLTLLYDYCPKCGKKVLDG